MVIKIHLVTNPPGTDNSPYASKPKSLVRSIQTLPLILDHKGI